MLSDRERQLLAKRFRRETPLKIHVITLSDRAHRGDYLDQSGPSVHEHLKRFVKNTGIHGDLTDTLLPDDPARLERMLLDACDKSAHVIVTTGGTGVGPRDHTPDVIQGIADKIIPGIMDAIRLKYGADKPLALLSRSIAAVRGLTLIYALPGSPKAVDEYMSEIVKTLPHLLCVLHETDPH